MQTVSRSTPIAQPSCAAAELRLAGDGPMKAALPTGVVGHPLGTRVPWPRVGPPELWSREDMRAACARRDVQMVYRLLNRAGLSQRAISRACGQTQGEVCEIIQGKRLVQSVDLLERIVDGLGCPRSWWGLAHDVSALGYAGDVARQVVAVAQENARQLAGTVANLTTQVVALLDILGVDAERRPSWSR